jgi:hypothetical protein
LAQTLPSRHWESLLHLPSDMQWPWTQVSPAGQLSGSSTQVSTQNRPSQTLPSGQSLSSAHRA